MRRELAGLNVIAVVKREEQVAAAGCSARRRWFKSAVTSRIAVAAVRAMTRKVEAWTLRSKRWRLPSHGSGRWTWSAKGGVVNFFGGAPAGTKVEFDTNRLHYNDITLRARFHHTPATCRRAFDLLAKRAIQCRQYITGRARADDLNNVFHQLMQRLGDIKTAIIP